MKRIFAMLLCLCLLPVMAGAATPEPAAPRFDFSTVPDPADRDVTPPAGWAVGKWYVAYNRLNQDRLHGSVDVFVEIRPDGTVSQMGAEGLLWQENGSGILLGANETWLSGYITENGLMCWDYETLYKDGEVNKLYFVRESYLAAPGGRVEAPAEGWTEGTWRAAFGQIGTQRIPMAADVAFTFYKDGTGDAGVQWEPIPGGVRVTQEGVTLEAFLTEAGMMAMDYTALYGAEAVVYFEKIQ